MTEATAIVAANVPAVATVRRSASRTSVEATYPVSHTKPTSHTRPTTAGSTGARSIKRATAAHSRVTTAKTINCAKGLNPVPSIENTFLAGAKQ